MLHLKPFHRNPMLLIGLASIVGISIFCAAKNQADLAKKCIPWLQVTAFSAMTLNHGIQAVKQISNNDS